MERDADDEPGDDRGSRATRNCVPQLAGVGTEAQFSRPRDDAVKLHPVIDEAEAEPLGDPLLQLLELLVDELDHLAGLDVDQMVVMGFGRGFVAGAAVAEIVALEDARFLEQANGAVDGGDRDAGIDRGGARVQRLDVGMVLGFARARGR